MCGGLHTATGDLRFDSFLTQEDVVIMLIYEVSSPRQCLSITAVLVYLHSALPGVTTSNAKCHGSTSSLRHRLLAPGGIADRSAIRLALLQQSKVEFSKQQGLSADATACCCAAGTEVMKM